MKLLKPRTSQPQDTFSAAQGKGIELLISGAVGAPWSTRGAMLPTSWTQGAPTVQGRAAQFTFSNADYQKLTRTSPLTLITVGVVTGTLGTGAYPGLIAGTLSGSFTRGGIELGVGGDLGGGAGDVGRVYSVVRSDTYRAEQTLIKTTATVSAGQIIVAMQRITPTLHELVVDGVGSASTATIADPGANNTETLKLGGTSGAATAYVIAHARITRYVPDAEWAYIKSNVWRALAEPRRIWVPVSITSGTTYTITPSGGVVLSGTGTQVDTKIIAPSGGVSMGGTGTMTFGSAGTTYTIIPSGGITMGGTGTQKDGKVFIPSGGITMGGSGLGLRTKNLTPSGGVAFGGSGNMTSNTSPVAANAGERTKVGAGT